MFCVFQADLVVQSVEASFYAVLLNRSPHSCSNEKNMEENGTGLRLHRKCSVCPMVHFGKLCADLEGTVREWNNPTLRARLKSRDTQFLERFRPGALKSA